MDDAFMALENYCRKVQDSLRLYFGNHISAQIFTNVLHVLRNLLRCKLPIKSNATQKIVILLLLHLCISSSLYMPSTMRLGIYFFAFYTLKNRIGILFCIKVRTCRMHPPKTFLTHYPLLPIISFIKINLFAINAIGVLFKLLLAAKTQSLKTYFHAILLIGCVMIFTKFVCAACEFLSGLWRSFGDLIMIDGLMILCEGIYRNSTGRMIMKQLQLINTIHVGQVYLSN